MFIPSFKTGQAVKREDIMREFGIAGQGGIQPSNSTNTVVLICDHTKSLYDDKWSGGILNYTGSGRIGDQELTRVNKTLADAPATGRSIHLFECYEPTVYIYRGQAELCAQPYQDVQLDDNNSSRTVWVFPLKLNSGDTISQKDLEKYTNVQRQAVSRLSPEQLKKQAQAASTKGSSSRTVISKTHIRNQAIAAYAKQRANGVCQLCGENAPFLDNDGRPYLESHHIEWLSRGGDDAIENTVALCPNCHKKMHVLDRMADKDILKKKAAA